MAAAGVAAGVPAGFAGAVAPLPVPFPEPEEVPFIGVAVPEVPVVVAAGVAGNDVSGVGSGGSGWERILATISFMPSTLSLFLYLYH